MTARSLMVLGTASHVGKSIVTTALCRIFARNGIRVAPFKAQNMSLNSAATVDGFEIGRAQALQAEAAGVCATRDMNPILLKPHSDSSCQVIIQGRIWKNLSAGEYHYSRVQELFPAVLESYQRLAENHDLVVLEGAGSPAEINLKNADIVNMRMAMAADAACLLVADIDRGGAFASLLGTLELLDGEERDRIRGFVINKFRGDSKLLAPGVLEMERRLQIPCAGVIPHIPDLGLDEEDSVALDSQCHRARPVRWDPEEHDKARRLRIAVVALPYLSNFTDFDLLAAEPCVTLQFVNGSRQLNGADVVVLPGSKQTIQDLQWLKDSGLADAIVRSRSNKLVVGICGGLQMLGTTVKDPHGLEGGGEVAGLGLLSIDTILNQEKVTAQVSARLVSSTLFGLPIRERDTRGYEIHLGETHYRKEAQPVLELRRTHAAHLAIQDGAQSKDGRVWGTYVHGLFDDDSFRHAFLRNARTACGLEAGNGFAFLSADRKHTIDYLADCVERPLDMELIGGWLQMEHSAHAASPTARQSGQGSTEWVTRSKQQRKEERRKLGSFRLKTQKEPTDFNAAE